MYNGDALRGLGTDRSSNVFLKLFMVFEQVFRIKKYVTSRFSIYFNVTLLVVSCHTGSICTTDKTNASVHIFKN